MEYLIRSKKILRKALCILSLIACTGTVYADTAETYKEAHEYVTDENNHKVTFKMPTTKNSDISGDVYVLYKGEKTDVYMVLSDLNNYSASQIVPQGKYRISSITNATNKEDYKYKSIDEFIVDDKDVEVYIHVSDNENNSINSSLIQDNIKEDKLMTFDVDNSKEQEEELRKSKMITNILIIADVIILILVIAIFLYGKKKRNSRKERKHAGNSKMV